MLNALLACYTVGLGARVTKLIRNTGVCFLIVATVAASPAAQAARMVTVVRGVGAGSDKAAALTGHFLRDLLSKDERYEVVDLNKSLGNQDRDRALKAFQSAEEMVQKGHDAYDQLDLDAAVEFLSNTLKQYERFAAYVNDFRKVSEALMLLGATHILRGEEKLGNRRLEQALNVFPQMEPDPRIFNPAMRGQFQETVSRMSTRPPGTLSVTSNPSYAEVYVDGKFAGVTPLAVERVSEGRHYVRLEKDGYRAWGKVVEVTGRTETAESAVLKATQHFDDFDNLVEAAVKRVVSPKEGNNGGPSNDAIDQLGVLTTADHIFLAQVRLDGERVQVWANQYDLNAQRLLRSAEHVFTYDARPEIYEREVGAMLRGAFGSESAAGKGKAQAKGAKGSRRDKDRDKDKDKDPMLDADALPGVGDARCWFNMPCRTLKIASSATSAGLGLVGMGVGAAFWAAAKKTNDQYRSQTQVINASPKPVANPQVNQLNAQGRTEALRGDIFFFAGAALAVVGVATWIWWEPAPSAADVLEHSNGHSASLQVFPSDGGGYFNAAFKF